MCELMYYNRQSSNNYISLFFAVTNVIVLCLLNLYLLSSSKGNIIPYWLSVKIMKVIFYVISSSILRNKQKNSSTFIELNSKTNNITFSFVL